jgi:hypothetical protein
MSSGEPKIRVERWRLDFEYRPGAQIEAWPQERVSQIGARLGKRADAVIFGDRGTAETAQLRKDEPHPVAPLPARAQLAERAIENRHVRRHEALEIEPVSHLNNPPRGASSVTVSGWRLSRPCPNLSIERKGRQLMTNSSPRLVIKNGTLIDGSGRDPIANSLIVVEGNRISHVGHADESMRPVSPDDRAIDATGKFILPGLIDAKARAPLTRAGSAPSLYRYRRIFR